jgi:hypothetical protein
LHYIEAIMVVTNSLFQQLQAVELVIFWSRNLTQDKKKANSPTCI